MTSEEIKQAMRIAPGAKEGATATNILCWLREIAYQLAVANEAKSKERTESESEVEYACGFATPGGFEESHRTTFKAEAEEWASRGPLSGAPDTMHAYGISRILPRADLKPDWFATIQARKDREQG